jgi:hypothetical protein
VNDIDPVCYGETTLQLLADDAKLYSNVVVKNISVSLQLSLDRLTQWAKDWQLHININKCSVLPVTHTARSSVRQYFINGVAISCQNSYVDLGVTVTSNLSSELHINNMVSKARQRISTLFRGFLTRNLYIMRQSFITYIRPILEYNSTVWNLSFIYLMDVIENVQRNFSKPIQSISSLSYLDRLAVLDLKPLELRRLRFDLIYYFEVLNHQTPFDPKDILTIYIRLLHHCVLILLTCKNLLKPQINYFTPYSIEMLMLGMRCLYIALRSVSSLFMFKSGLINVDISRY